MLRFEDRELEIRLAELQADIQIYTAGAFGFMAAFLALAVTFIQLLFTASSETTILVLAMLALITSACLPVFSVRFLTKASQARKQMKELRKRYIF